MYICIHAHIIPFCLSSVSMCFIVTTCYHWLTNWRRISQAWGTWHVPLGPGVGTSSRDMSCLAARFCSEFWSWLSTWPNHQHAYHTYHTWESDHITNIYIQDYNTPPTLQFSEHQKIIEMRLGSPKLPSIFLHVLLWLVVCLPLWKICFFVN